MSIPALATRSGVSEATVKRILKGKDASHTKTEAVAHALGIRFQLITSQDPLEFQQEQARAKARLIARMVQGTSALESQAVDAASFERLVERSYHDLMAGPSSRLWAS